MTTDMTQFPEASRAYAEQFEKRSGRLLNIHAGMAASPAVIAAYAGLSAGVAKHATLDRATREAIALAVGNQNGCDYCEAAHTDAASKAGLSEDQVAPIRAGEVTFDSKLDALLEVARGAAANIGPVDPAIRAHATRQGWTEDEVAEVFAHLAVNLYTNFFNHYAGTELDFPAAAPLS